MRRREFVMLAGAAVSWPLCTRAQPAAKIPRIGILWHAGSPEEEGIFYQSLHQGLRDVGYIVGKNLAVEERFPGEVSARFEQFAKELVSLNVDVLVAVSAPSALAAQKATTTLPVVFLPIVDPVALKLVSSLARPEGNMTGLSTMGVDLAAKRVQFVKDTIPAAMHIALLYDPVVPYNIVQEISVSKTAGDQLKVRVTEFKAHEVEELDPVFATIGQQACDAIILAQGPMFFLKRAKVSDLAKKQRMPMMGPAEVFAGAGIVMSYGANWPAIFRRAPVYVDKILKGAKPADLPVEQPTKFDLVVNLVVAKALGIEVPALVLARADRVIE